MSSQISRSNIEIALESCGEGEITLLFVHGWCIDKSYWSEQLEAFCPEYRVVLIDLPGFGNSGKNRNSWTIEEYGKDLVAVIDQLSLQNVVLVGHSMSGEVILEAAIDQPNKVIALIGIDNFKQVGMVYDETLKAEVATFLDALGSDFQLAVSTYAASALFHESTTDEVKDRVTRDFANADPAAAIGSFESMFAYITERRPIAQLRQRLYLINSTYTPTFTEGLDSADIDYRIYGIDSTGHYPMIERPGEFNRILGKIVKKIERDLHKNEIH